LQIADSICDFFSKLYYLIEADGYYETSIARDSNRFGGDRINLQFLDPFLFAMSQTTTVLSELETIAMNRPSREMASPSRDRLQIGISNNVEASSSFRTST